MEDHWDALPSKENGKEPDRDLYLINPAVPLCLRLQESLADMVPLSLAIDELDSQTAVQHVQVCRDWVNHPV